MGMTFDNYCKEQGIHWAMREDPWVQSLFSSVRPSADEQIEKIRAIQKAEDFREMNEQRMEAYEAMLKIPFLTPNRRDVIQGFWAGWGSPSTERIKYICSTICNTDPTNIQVTYGTQLTPTFPIVNVYIDPDTLLSGGYLFLCSKAIRKHIPAHYAMDVSGDFDFLTINEMESTKLEVLAGKDGSVELWNFKN